MDPGSSVALWCAAAFLCGSIPFGWLAARAKGVDLRQVGSGNVGATNAWRVLGRKYGIAVLILDALKGLVPVAALTSWLASTQGSQQSEAWQASALMLCGAFAIFGHTFTPWLKFKGGKGVATGLGVIVALYHAWVLIPLGVFGLALAASRYVSLSSILAVLCVAVLSFAVEVLRPLWPFGLFSAALVLWTHRSNIARIIAGTERSVGKKA
ncbi:glycerol-3-phosphate 1-O-acyltransferase PlsY [bacterium]|nr:glycerol-3-phosphate 1-O-acyltransferase PlsY [bacterium]